MQEKGEESSSKTHTLTHTHTYRGGVVVVLVGPEVRETRERQSGSSGTKAGAAVRGGRVVFIAASA